MGVSVLECVFFVLSHLLAQASFAVLCILLPARVRITWQTQPSPVQADTLHFQQLRYLLHICFNPLQLAKEKHTYTQHNPQQANGMEGKSLSKAWKVDPSLFSSSE
jgi:hypothetical protein